MVLRFNGVPSVEGGKGLCFPKGKDTSLVKIFPNFSAPVNIFEPKGLLDKVPIALSPNFSAPRITACPAFVFAKPLPT